MKWEHFSHDADMGVRGIGTTVDEAFIMAAVALTAVIADPLLIPPTIEVKVACEAPDLELLLVDWLNSVIYQMDTQDILFSQFEIKMEQNALQGILRGEKIKNLKMDLGVDIKGATYSELKVAKEQNVWIAQCILDV